MSEKNLFRLQLGDWRKYVPGKPIEEVKKEYGLTEIVKLASNENPLGPSPKAVEAIQAEALKLNIYPESTAEVLRETLASQYNLDPDQVVVGNGGEEVIKMIIQATINEGDEVIMASPSFVLYEICSKHMGADVVKIPLKNFEHDLSAFKSHITDNTKIVFVCNPNNPTGNIMSREVIEDFARDLPSDVILFLDEAYYEYAVRNANYPDSISILDSRPNTVVMRTFSKVAGIAGARVGYAFTSKEIAEQVSKIKGVFNVNRLAQVGGVAAFKDTAHIQNTVDLSYTSLKLMEDYFDQKGLDYVKSNANFLFADLGVDSRESFEALMKLGIIIRPGYLWGYDTWIRVSTGTVEETEKFIQAVEKVLTK